MHDPLSCLAYTAHILSQQQQEQQQQQQASDQQHQQQNFQHRNSSGNPNSHFNASLSDPEPVDTMTADAEGDAADSDYEYGYGSGVMDDRSTDNEAAAAAAAGTATGARRGTTTGASAHYRWQALCDRTASAGGPGGPGAPPSTPIGGAGSGSGSGGHGDPQRGRERERAGLRAASPSADAEERSYGGGGRGSSKRPAGRRPVQFWGPFNDWWRSEFERTGKRPGADLVGEWYAAHAASCWGREAPSLEETRTHAKCLRSVGSIREYFRSYRARKKARLEDGPSPAAAAATHDRGSSYSTIGPDPAAAAMAIGLPRGSAGGVGAHGCGLQNLAALSCLLPQLSQLNALGLSPLQVVAAAAAAANNNTKAGASGVPAAAAGPSPSRSLGFHDIDALAAAAASAGSLLGSPPALTADAGPDCGISGGLLSLPYGIAADPSGPLLALLPPPLQPDPVARGCALVGGGGANGSSPLLALPPPGTATASPHPSRPIATVTTGDGPSPRSVDAAAGATGATSHAVQRPAVVTFTNATAATSATATSRGADCQASIGGTRAGDRFCRTSSHGGCLDATADDVAPAQSAKGAGAGAVPTLPEAKREEAFSFRVASALASGCGSGSDGGKSCGSTPPPLSQPVFGPCGGLNAAVAANLPQQLLESMPYLDAAAVVQVTPRASAPAASGGFPPQRRHSLSQQQQQQPQRRQPACPSSSPAANGADGGAPAFRAYGSGPVGAAGSPRRLSTGFRASAGANANPPSGPGCMTDDEHSLSLSQRGGRSAVQQHEEEVHLQLPFHREHRHRPQQQEEDAQAASQHPPSMPMHSPAWSSSPSEYGKYEYGKYCPPHSGHQLQHQHQQPHPGAADKSQNSGASPTAVRSFPPVLPPHHLHHAYPFGHHYPQQHPHQLISLSGGSARFLPRSPSSSQQQQQSPRYSSHHQLHTHTQHPPPPPQQLRDVNPRQQALLQPQQLQGPPHSQAPGSSKQATPCGPNDTPQHSTAAAANNITPVAAVAAGSASATTVATAALAAATAGGPAEAQQATTAAVPSLRSLLARPDNELCGLLHELPHDQLVLLLLRAVALVRQKKAHEERLMDELAQVLEQQGNLQAQLHAQRMENAKMYRAIMAIRDERSSGGVEANPVDVAAAAAVAAVVGMGLTGGAASPPPPPLAAAPPRPTLPSDEVGATIIARGSAAATAAHGNGISPRELAVATGGSPAAAAAGMAMPAAPTAVAAAAAAAAAVMRNSGRDRVTWPATGHQSYRGGGVAGGALAAALPAASAIGAGGCGGGAGAVEDESCGRLGVSPCEQHDEPHHSGSSGQSQAHPTDATSQGTDALQGKATPGAAVAAAAAAAMTPMPCSLTAHSPAVGVGIGVGAVGGGGGIVRCGESMHSAVLQPPPSGKPAVVAFSDGGSGTSSAF